MVHEYNMYMYLRCSHRSTSPYAVHTVRLPCQSIQIKRLHAVWGYLFLQHRNTRSSM